MRIAIAGAGVAGSAAAAGLARLGNEVTLFEAVPQPEPIGAGLLLQPTGQQVLAHLGLLDIAMAHGARLDGLLGDTAGGRTVIRMSYRRFAPHAFGLGLQRGALMGLLWQAVRQAGVDWRCGVPVARFDQDAAGVTLWSEPGENLGRYDALVVADGSFSRLRRELDLPQRATLFPWGALWTVLPVPAGFPAIELRQRFRAARQMLGLMPVGRNWGGREAGINLFWSVPLADMQALDQLDLSAWKRPLVELLPLSAPLLEGLKDPRQLRVARYADVRLPRWHEGRVLVIGDSAHGMSPQLGQGANMALIDAHVLSLALRDAPDVPAAWASFSDRRRAHLRFYGQASRLLTPLFQSNARWRPWLRDLAMGPAGRLPWLHDQNVAVLAGMKTGWLWGRLNLDDNPWSSAA